MDVRMKRHCWECRRRCLVCDFTEPACRRCAGSGVKCPGYGDVKPTRLKWLAPGRVTSRDRRRNGFPPPTFPANSGEVPAMGTLVSIPRFETWTGVYALAQAAEYFNSCIYRDLVPIRELGPNPHIYSLSSAHLRTAASRPDYLLFGMVCMTLSHRLNQTRGDDPYSGALAEKFYLYWGLAVRSLNEHLDVRHGQPGDMVMAGVLTLLLTDLQQGTSLNWRCHLDGIHKLIALRGGFHAMAESKALEPLLLVLWSVSVIGNTTCPASDLSMTGLHFDALELLVKQFSAAASPIQLCPLPLFAEITRINHLRARATWGEAEKLTAEAYEILGRIRAFSSEKWAASKASSKEDWMLVGDTYQSAVALYCTLSLQSLSVLPETRELRRSNAAHGQVLHVLLDRALPSAKIKRSMVWPLVLLGVQAVHGPASTRAFVSKHLRELSRSLGTHVPLTAQRVLEVFWESGETQWDACFDRAYAFTAQIAVDTSRLLPESKIDALDRSQ